MDFGRLAQFAGRTMTMSVIDIDAYHEAPTKGKDMKGFMEKQILNYLRDYQASLGDMLLNLLPGGSLKAVAGEIINENVSHSSKTYKFRINPQKLHIESPKLIVAVEYGRYKYDIMPWGDKLMTYRYSGTTGAFLTDEALQRRGIKDIRLSRAWLKFESFREFFLSRSDWLLVLFDMEAFLGYFESFSFDRNADQPWHINYEFVLKVNPASRINLVSGKLFKLGTLTGIGRSALNYSSSVIKTPVGNPNVSTGVNIPF